MQQSGRVSVHAFNQPYVVAAIVIRKTMLSSCCDASVGAVRAVIKDISEFFLQLASFVQALLGVIRLLSAHDLPGVVQATYGVNIAVHASYIASKQIPKLVPGWTRSTTSNGTETLQIRDWNAGIGHLLAAIVSSIALAHSSPDTMLIVTTVGNWMQSVGFAAWMFQRWRQLVL